MVGNQIEAASQRIFILLTVAHLYNIVCRSKHLLHRFWRVLPFPKARRESSAGRVLSKAGKGEPWHNSEAQCRAIMLVGPNLRSLERRRTRYQALQIIYYACGIHVCTEIDSMYRACFVPEHDVAESIIMYGRWNWVNIQLQSDHQLLR